MLTNPVSDINDNLLVLPSTKREVGHLVIINEYDRPCQDLIAVISRIDERDEVTIYYCAYLNDKLTRIIDDRICLIGTVNPTPLSEFGVQVKFDITKLAAKESPYIVEETQENSTATYPDGHPRFWQGA